MIFVRLIPQGFGRLCVLLFVGMLLVAPAIAEAQSPRGARPQQPRNQPNEPKQSASTEDSGSIRGTITKFAPAKESEDEELLGFLKFKPLEKNGKLMTLAVRKTDTLVLDVPGAKGKLDPEQAADFFWKGLYCTAHWDIYQGSAKKPPAKRELTQLTFDTIEIEGKIKEISDDHIIIMARPKAGDWPGVDQPASAGRGGTPGTPAKLPQQKKLKLRVIEDITQYEDSQNQPLDAGDFEVDESVDASVVFGKSEGMIVALRTPGPRGPRPTQQAGPRPPPKQRGGRAAGGG